jgi:TonB family protein
MLEFLKYDLKVAVLIAIFYLFYRLLLSRDTFHRLNRMVLLSTAVASFVLPFCVFTFHHTVVMESLHSTVAVGHPLVAIVEPSLRWWQMGLVVMFFLGVCIVVGHVVWSIMQVVRLVMRSECHPQDDGVIIAVTDKKLAPFSWMRYIVLNVSDFEHQDPAIMAHERAHIRQRHSLDVLLVDTLTALQWFNPAIWMLRQDLRAIHEYEADAAVLSQGINMRQYLYLLIQKAAGSGGYSIVNGITHSTLKNRINMMLNHKKSIAKSWMKLLALLPILGTVLALNAETVNDYVYQQPQKKIVKKGRKAGKVNVSGKTIEVKADTEVGTVPISIKVIDGKKGNLENPLVLIDGKRSTIEEVQALDPQAIDHIDVLKDKAAIEVYGEEGKNGVILITTKNATRETVTATGQPSSPTATSDDVEVVVVDTGIETNDSEAFDVVEKMPEYPGGIEAFMKFLSMNIRYPEAASKAGIQGRVLVNFIVEKDGSISNIHVINNVNEFLDAEAIRVVGTMPKWTPGMQAGEAVRVKYTVPITFRLN